MKFLLLIFSGMLVIFGSAGAQSQEVPWQLHSSEDGIQLYTRPVAGNALNEVKAVLVLTGNIDSAFRLINDPIRFSSTDSYVSSTKIIQQIDSNDVYTYMVIKTPFFMKDRDAVARSRSQRTANGYFLAGEPAEGILPPAPNLIRDDDFRIYVSLQRLAADSFELTYKLTIAETDLPVGMANKAMLASTFDRMKLLRKLITSQATADR